MPSKNRERPGKSRAPKQEGQAVRLPEDIYRAILDLQSTLYRGLSIKAIVVELLKPRLDEEREFLKTVKAAREAHPNLSVEALLALAVRKGIGDLVKPKK